MNSKFLRMLSVAIISVGMIVAFHTVSAQEAAAPAAVPAVAAPAAAAPAEAPAATAPVAVAPDVKPAVTSALELRKTGIVSVVKDASGTVTGLKLIVNSYEIPLDEGSKPLENMDGQKVRVTGTFSNEGGKRMFYVKSVEPVTTEGTAASPAQAAPAK
ncbi:MAG: hypothetical protein KJ964_05025 [Verrucomicrobia bacterium]|nr:hypothetical protein [Verrucomicrobiota bacterium]MBU1734446.1 hypothetical protein [Verrucomicrobiota bacterium]MBU1856090.1 hypothetical protein [Verrucomicrobiota bacterium]